MYNGLDLTNRRGKPFCHKIKCRVSKDLNQAYGGLFCNKHLLEIADIRCRLEQVKYIESKTPQDWLNEIKIRQEEMLFRKIMEPGHMNYLLDLEKLYLN